MHRAIRLLIHNRKAAVVIRLRGKVANVIDRAQIALPALFDIGKNMEVLLVHATRGAGGVAKGHWFVVEGLVVQRLGSGVGGVVNYTGAAALRQFLQYVDVARVAGES